MYIIAEKELNTEDEFEEDEIMKYKSTPGNSMAQINNASETQSLPNMNIFLASRVKSPNNNMFLYFWTFKFSELSIESNNSLPDRLNQSRPKRLNRLSKARNGLLSRIR